MSKRKSIAVWGLVSVMFISCLPLVGKLVGADISYNDITYALGSVVTITLAYLGIETKWPSNKPQ